MPVDHKQVIIDKIRSGECLSVFWVSLTQRRAAAMDALIKSGEVIRRDDDPRDRFPWMVFTVADPPGAETVKAACSPANTPPA